MHLEPQNGICIYNPAIFHKDNKRICANRFNNVIFFLIKYLDYYKKNTIFVTVNIKVMTIMLIHIYVCLKLSNTLTNLIY